MYEQVLSKLWLHTLYHHFKEWMDKSITTDWNHCDERDEGHDRDIYSLPRCGFPLFPGSMGGLYCPTLLQEVRSHDLSHQGTVSQNDLSDIRCMVFQSGCDFSLVSLPLKPPVELVASRNDGAPTDLGPWVYGAAPLPTITLLTHTGHVDEK